MIKAQVLTQWNKTEEGLIPDAIKFLRPQESLMDVTGEQKCDRHTINPVVVELWCSKETLADIETAYGAGAVLSVEPIEDDKTPVKTITKTALDTHLSSLVKVPVSLKTSVTEWIKARPVEVIIKEVIIDGKMLN